MVMFLRTTQSPTVFLQQLGRRLRKFEGKKYINVLDLIGNYRKSDLILFLLSEKIFKDWFKRGLPNEEEYSENCDLASKEMKIKDRIREEFLRERVILYIDQAELNFLIIWMIKFTITMKWRKK